jgi:NAD(P)-dependent dehydrogenase (short-subunit alcohol dehydrogenase family)
VSQVALVTGASAGVGAATAKLLAERGWTVYGLSRRGTTPAGTTGLSADVTQPETLHKAVQRILTEQGHLDVVLHCAGIGGAGPVEQMPEAEARRIVDTNFWGAFHVNRAVLPHLRKRDRAYLIHVSSIAGLMGIPFRSMYSASKAALEAMTESLRLEVRNTGIRVCTLCPGDIATDIIAAQYRMPYEEVDPTYRAAYTAADSGMADNVEHGMPASAVAEYLYGLLQKDNLKVRYILGEPIQKISTYAKRLLPGRVYERILAGYYKL